jgi:hypothetical protein
MVQRDDEQPDPPDAAPAAPERGSAAVPVIRLGPAGIEDPETTWDFGQPEEPLPMLEPGQYLLLLPGEEILVADRRPKLARGQVAVLVGEGELVLHDRRSNVMPTPLGGAPADDNRPVATDMLVILIQYRTSGVTGRPLRYLIVVDREANLLGWLDYSDGWGLNTDHLREMARMVGMSCEVERFATQLDFEQTHPDWLGRR